MHLSSIDKMKQFKEAYLSDKKNSDLTIIDLGSKNIGGSYRSIFDNQNWKYMGLDLSDGENVDVVLSDPYSWLEIESNSADVFISGQTFEHIEYFWITMLEIARVLKHGGFCCIIAPSAGPEHKYPVDCWRFYSDGFKALAQYANLELLEVSTQRESKGYSDGSDIWADTMLVAKKPEKLHKEKVDQEHIYKRIVDENSGDSLSRIIKHISPNTTILELGPATGYLTEYLKNNLHCIVDCVELSSEMAEKAQKFCRNMVIEDLDKILLEEHFKEKYDYIIIADVLEHIKEAEKLIKSCHSLLNEKGKCLLSIPNIAHASILGNLFKGKFEYTDEGLLDQGHLRFFTRDSIHSCLKQCGFFIESIETINKLPEDTEIGDSLTDLPHDLQLAILNKPDSLAYQFIVVCKPSDNMSELNGLDVAPQVSAVDLRKAYISNVNDQIASLHSSYLERIEGLENELSFASEIAYERLDRMRELEKVYADARQMAYERLDKIHELEKVFSEVQQMAYERLDKIHELNKIANERLNTILLYQNYFTKLEKIPFFWMYKKIARIK